MKTVLDATCERCCGHFDDYQRNEWFDWRRAMFRYPMVLCETCIMDLKSMVDMWWAVKHEQRKQHDTPA